MEYFYFINFSLNSLLNVIFVRFRIKTIFGIKFERAFVIIVVLCFKKTVLINLEIYFCSSFYYSLKKKK